MNKTSLFTPGASALIDHLLRNFYFGTRVTCFRNFYRANTATKFSRLKILIILFAVSRNRGTSGEKIINEKYKKITGV